MSGLILLALTACNGVKEGPLGIPLANDGVTYAGVAVIDITPEITETFTDLDGNADFDGCFDDPDASEPGCDEPFDDADGDGWFDAVFIGGFGPRRPANEVHDPIYARALVLAQDREYVAMVSLDLVGLGSPRIHAARDALAADGFEADHLLAASTHNHQGPDTMGLWGDPEDLANPITGKNEDYQQRVTAAIEQAVRDAAADMVPVDLTVGQVRTRHLSPWFSGEMFGGKSPDPIQHGLIHDGRDPIVISDQLLVLQGTREDGVLFTWTNWSGHPEVRGSNNNAISSDWPGAARMALEQLYPDSVAIHMPESLGGMQSALGGELPLVLDDGTHVYQTCSDNAVTDLSDTECYGHAVDSARIDADGDEVPAWAARNSWAFVTSHGWHIAEAAAAALEEGEAITAAPIRVEAEDLYVPVENVVYKILGPQGMFDLDLEDLEQNPELCPEVADGEDGCLLTRTFRAQIGPIGLVAVPGELLPELFWGMPVDADWSDEVDDPTARGDGATYFPQHDHDCDALEYAECTDEISVGDCDCLRAHAWPYVLNHDPAVPPMFDLLDTEYRAALSMTDDYLSYIVPEPDFNTAVSLLTDDGDHYEDTVSPGHTFATRVQEAQLRIDERW